MSFAWDHYLARVGLDGIPKPDESGLRELHDAQFLNIPFENFDIQLGRGVSLAAQHVFDKLVNHRRGGYCFELNGLMLEALSAAGFQARPLLARVHLGPHPSGLTHQVSLVELGGRSWLMDVGFGAGGLRCPLPIEADRCEENTSWGFRLVADDQWGMMMQSREKGVWKDSYSFDRSLAYEVDREVGNHYTSTSPESQFVTTRKASLPTANGRVSLLDFVKTTIEGEHKETTEVPDDQSYLDELAAVFNIDLEVPYTSLRKLSKTDHL